MQRDKKKSLILMLPVFNDWTSVNALLPLIDAALRGVDARVHVNIVDDGSTDPSGGAINPGAQFGEIESVRVIRLIRNEGTQRAIALGLAYIAENDRSDLVCVMDADHEDKPEYIRDMLDLCNEKNESYIIFANRTKRSEGLLFRIFYWLYRCFFYILTGKYISFGNYSIVPWRYVSKLCHMSELYSHYSAAILRSKLPFSKVNTVRGKRFAGRSSMNMTSLMVHGFSGFSVFADVAAARLFAFAFFLSLAILVAMGVVVALRTFTDLPAIGWSSQVVLTLGVILIQLFSWSVILLFLSLIMKRGAASIPAREFSQYIEEIAVLYDRGMDTDSVVKRPKGLDGPAGSGLGW